MVGLFMKGQRGAESLAVFISQVGDTHPAQHTIRVTHSTDNTLALLNTQSGSHTDNKYTLFNTQPG